MTTYKLTLECSNFDYWKDIVRFACSRNSWRTAASAESIPWSFFKSQLLFISQSNSNLGSFPQDKGSPIRYGDWVASPYTHALFTFVGNMNAAHTRCGVGETSWLWLDFETLHASEYSAQVTEFYFLRKNKKIKMGRSGQSQVQSVRRKRKTKTRFRFSFFGDSFLPIWWEKVSTKTK